MQTQTQNIIKNVDNLNKYNKLQQILHHGGLEQMEFQEKNSRQYNIVGDQIQLSAFDHVFFPTFNNSYIVKNIQAKNIIQVMQSGYYEINIGIDFKKNSKYTYELGGQIFQGDITMDQNCIRLYFEKEFAYLNQLCGSKIFFPIQNTKESIQLKKGNELYIIISFNLKDLPANPLVQNVRVQIDPIGSNTFVEFFKI